MKQIQKGRQAKPGAAILVGAVAAALGAVATVAAAPSASATVLYCGSSEYVTSIRVQDFADGNFKVIVTPTSSARTALDPHAATVDEWHAIQSCIPGLYGSLADSIWDQLECHQGLALVPGEHGWATGPTYDLETWHGTFSEGDWLSTHCGNQLGIEPEGPFGTPHDPSAGQSDLQPPANIA